MVLTIDAEYDGASFIPIEHISLEKNKKYRLIIEETTDEENQTAWDILQSHIGSVDGPEDWSENLDHYLYGSPKNVHQASLNE